MKIPNLDGEFGFRGLVKDNNKWELTNVFFFSKEEFHYWATKYNPAVEYKWPAEVWEDGSVYIANPEELK